MGLKRVAASVGLAVALSTAPAVTTSAQAATGVCSGVSYCKVVSRADVDGDGRADQVGLVQRSKNPAGSRVTVRVRTAKGRTMSTAHEARWYGSTWHGAAKVDGVAGHDLVVGTDVGAHLMTFRIITVRAGKLVTLKAPGNQYRWHVDSSYSFNEGWTRSVSKGVVSMTHRIAGRSTARSHQLVTTRSVWRSGTWRRVSSRTSTVSDRTGSTVGGWRIPYLKRFPTFQ